MTAERVPDRLDALRRTFHLVVDAAISAEEALGGNAPDSEVAQAVQVMKSHCDRAVTLVEGLDESEND